MKYNERGEELPDPTEVEVPTGLRRPPTLAEQIKAMVRGELSRQAAQQGFESFEEADDFDVPEDDDMVIDSPHEMTEEQEFRDASDLSKVGSDSERELDGRGQNADNSGTRKGGVADAERGRAVRGEEGNAGAQAVGDADSVRAASGSASGGKGQGSGGDGAARG